MRKTLGAILSALLLVLFAGCSDDTEDKVDDAAQSVREDAEDAAGSAAARATAESMRADLLANDLPENQTVRDVAVLQQTADDLPGDVQLSGVADADGDGKDDDGKVQVDVGDQSACLTVADNGDVDVSGGACS
jgi:hypothetical protein